MNTSIIDNITELEKISTYKKLVKGKYLITENEYCDSKFRIVKGLFYAGVQNENGKLFVNSIAKEGEWICDFNSLYFGKKTSFDIISLEDSEVLQLSKEDYDQNLSNSHYWAVWSNKLMQQEIAKRESWQRAILDSNYAHRILWLHTNHPYYIKRVPQYILARYLNMAPETFSRHLRYLDLNQ